jgi:hypothetical protein
MGTCNQCSKFGQKKGAAGNSKQIGTDALTDTVIKGSKPMCQLTILTT